MKILFVYNDINVKGGARSYHFGLGILAAVMQREGHEIRLFYDYEKFNLPGLQETVRSFGPEIVAFTTDSSQYVHMRAMIRGLREGGYRGFIIAGGPHPSLCPSTLEQTAGLDAICVGEGEGALTELAERLGAGRDPRDIRSLWVRTPEGIVCNPGRPFIEDLDALPFGNREIFDYQRVIESDFDRAIFMMSRGCPFNCTYCGSPAMGKLQEGRYVRFRSVENGLAEVEQVLSRYRAKTLFFADDVFTMRKEYVLEFCEQYKRRFKLPFEVTTRVESSSLESFQALKDAGCWRVAIGVESGSEQFRAQHLNRRMKNSQIIQAFADARKAGLVTKSYNIVGFPHETKELFEETVKLNAAIDPDTHALYIFNPYPGTRLHEVCVEQGWLDTHADDFVHRTDTPLRMPQFTREEILHAYRNFSFKVYWKRSMVKALVYKVYYSRFGEKIIRLLGPVKKSMQRLVMERKRKRSAA